MNMEFLEAVLDLRVRPELPQSRFKCPDPLRALITRCWAPDPHERLTFPEVSARVCECVYVSVFHVARYARSLMSLSVMCCCLALVHILALRESVYLVCV